LRAAGGSRSSISCCAAGRDQGYEVVSLGTLFRSLDVERLPRCEVVYRQVPGRSGTLAAQAEERS